MSRKTHIERGLKKTLIDIKRGIACIHCGLASLIVACVVVVAFAVAVAFVIS